MKLEFISAQMKERLQRYGSETLSMGPYDTANFLLLCGETLLKYIEYSNKQIEPDSQAFIGKSDISKIDDLFRELGNNFFPMAHTNEPLRNLKIVNARQYEDLNARVNYLITNFAEHYENNMVTSIEMKEREVRLNRELIAELRNIREEIRTLLNP
jgi:hypothetical protein